MWETRSIQLDVRLPGDLAAQAEQVLKDDPEYFSRIVLYGLTRLSIYNHLRDRGGELGTDAAETAAVPT